MLEAPVWHDFCGSADILWRREEALAKVIMLFAPYRFWVAFCRCCLYNSAVHKNNYWSCKVWTKTRPTIGCFSTYSRAISNLVPRFFLLPVLSRSVVTGKREPWERGWRIRHFSNKKGTGGPQLFLGLYWGRARQLLVNFSVPSNSPGILCEHKLGPLVFKVGTAQVSKTPIIGVY